MSSVRGLIKSSYLIGIVTGVTNLRALVSGTMGASITGPTTQIDKLDNICYQVSWTSSNAVGVISVQGSIDGTNFVDLTFTPALTQPNSDDGSYLINLADVPFPLIRVKYTRTSGTGNMKVYLSAKGA